TRGLVAVRLRRGGAGSLGIAGKVQAHRALQVLSGARIEADVSRQAAVARARPLPLPQGRVPLAGRDVAHGLGSTGAKVVMTKAPPPLLLINLPIIAGRNARFPLAVLALSDALEGRYASTILDGNIDRDFVATAVRKVTETPYAAVGVTVMGGPQLRHAIAVSKAIRAASPETP